MHAGLVAEANAFVASSDTQQACRAFEAPLLWACAPHHGGFETQSTHCSEDQGSAYALAVRPVPLL